MASRYTGSFGSLTLCVCVCVCVCAVVRFIYQLLISYSLLFTNDIIIIMLIVTVNRKIRKKKLYWQCNDCVEFNSDTSRDHVQFVRNWTLN